MGLSFFLVIFYFCDYLPCYKIKFDLIFIPDEQTNFGKLGMGGSTKSVLDIIYYSLICNLQCCIFISNVSFDNNFLNGDSLT